MEILFSNNRYYYKAVRSAILATARLFVFVRFTDPMLNLASVYTRVNG